MVWPFVEVGSSGRGVGWRKDDQCCAVTWQLKGTLGRRWGTCWTDPGSCEFMAEGQEVRTGGLEDGEKLSNHYNRDERGSTRELSARWWQ